MTRIANKDGSVHQSAMLAHVMATPLPVFDPDREVIDRVHSQNAMAADNAQDLNQPVTNASIAAK